MKSVKGDIEYLEAVPFKGKMKDFDAWERSDDWGKGRKMYRYIERLLEKSVGKSYNEVYSKFCNDLKNRKDLYSVIGCWDAKKAFNDYFLDKWGISKYDVKNGMIKKVPIAYRKHNPSITLADSSIEYYAFNHNFDKDYPDLISIMEEKIGKDITYSLVNEHIPVERFKKIAYSHNVKYNFNDALRDKGVKNHGYYLTFNDLFSAYGLPPTEVKKGEDGYDRIKSEIKDHNNKVKREIKKEKEIKNSEMLYKIEERRKAILMKDNEVTRDRLGFNEESFKGEFYHGQKRKKR